MNRSYKPSLEDQLMAMKGVVIKTDEDFEAFCKMAAGFKRQGWRILELYRYPSGGEMKYCIMETTLRVAEAHEVRYFSGDTSKELKKLYEKGHTFPPLEGLWDKGEVKDE